jgi:hypothetical protein
MSKGMPMKIIMTLLVRDAEAIIRDNLDFHLRQGVDYFIITDNCSVDGTVGIIEEYVGRGRAELILEPQDDYSQSHWVTRMARRAATHHGADWVVNNDDDEFWLAHTGCLRDALKRTPNWCEGLVVKRYNHPPLADYDGRAYLEAMVYRECKSQNAFDHSLSPKVCHRAFADIIVAQGNHMASRVGGPLNVCPSLDFSISHFPIRDFASFERKIVNGGAAYARNTELSPDVGATWRWLYSIWQEGKLRAWYEQQLLTPTKIKDGISRSFLVIDDAVLRALRSDASM